MPPTALRLVVALAGLALVSTAQAQSRARSRGGGRARSDTKVKAPVRGVSPARPGALDSAPQRGVGAAAAIRPAAEGAQAAPDALDAQPDRRLSEERLETLRPVPEAVSSEEQRRLETAVEEVRRDQAAGGAGAEPSGDPFKKLYEAAAQPAAGASVSRTPAAGAAPAARAADAKAAIRLLADNAAAATTPADSALGLFEAALGRVERAVADAALKEPEARREVARVLDRAASKAEAALAPLAQRAIDDAHAGRADAGAGGPGAKRERSAAESVAAWQALFSPPAPGSPEASGWRRLLEPARPPLIENFADFELTERALRRAAQAGVTVEKPRVRLARPRGGRSLRFSPRPSPQLRAAEMRLADDAKPRPLAEEPISELLARAAGWTVRVGGRETTLPLAEAARLWVRSAARGTAEAVREAAGDLLGAISPVSVQLGDAELVSPDRRLRKLGPLARKASGEELQIISGAAVPVVFMDLSALRAADALVEALARDELNVGGLRSALDAAASLARFEAQLTEREDAALAVAALRAQFDRDAGALPDQAPLPEPLRALSRADGANGLSAWVQRIRSSTINSVDRQLWRAVEGEERPRRQARGAARAVLYADTAAGVVRAVARWDRDTAMTLSAVGLQLERSGLKEGALRAYGQFSPAGAQEVIAGAVKALSGGRREATVLGQLSALRRRIETDRGEAIVQAHRLSSAHPGLRGFERAGQLDIDGTAFELWSRRGAGKELFLLRHPDSSEIVFGAELAAN